MTKLCYSTDEENFCFDEICDAIEDALYGAEEGDMATIYSGETVDNKASDFVRDIVEDMGDRAHDDCGEFAMNWPDSSAVQDLELQTGVDALVNDWANKYNLHPTFYKIENVKEIVIKLLNSETGEFKVL